MPGRRYQSWIDYAVAVLLTAAVIVAREALSGWLGRSAPFLPSIAAVLIAAFLGGLGPGLVATMLSAAASDFFFVAPIFSLRIEKLVHGADLLLFVVLGVLISALCDKRLRLVRQLREADRRKDEFLATLGHELRNPLAPIGNALELWPLIETDRLQTRSLREMMQRQLKQMVRLIDDLMDVSRITHGKIQLRRECVNLAAAVSGAIEVVEPFIKSCGHELSISTPAAPLFVDGDLARLTQVFGNVLHNAAKYSKRNGSIRVVIDQQGQRAVVRIEDNGPGIAANMLSRVFEMFEQVDQTLDRSHGGVGIGLTLCKRLVELHNGTIEARSDGSHGSEFIITLPTASAPCNVDEVQKAPSSIHDLANAPHHRILVVDDMEPSAMTLAQLLRAVGQDAWTANDGPTAIESVRENKPDIVFLDIAMPGMDGIEVARRIRDTATHDVTLVALSGYGQETDRRQAFAVGFNHYLTKPVAIEALRELLSTRTKARECSRTHVLEAE
ncbi:MAG TPA: ATP-binding protein [Planctomycetaceae bacterium]|jgi:signal transduction histidine kinase/ActR/RegA family two-component response regulator|nr:ATP-binding protein [Planctomycetaceae bacterium]